MEYLLMAVRTLSLAQKTCRTTGRNGSRWQALLAAAACLFAANVTAFGDSPEKGQKTPPAAKAPEGSAAQLLPVYAAVPGVSGNLKSIGSNTLNQVMAHWAEGFKGFYPSVTIEVEDKGSKGAPPALIEGQAQFGPMSREMTPKETDAFEKKFGYKPTGLRVAIDCIAIFVHKDNPVTELTLAQAERIFSVAGPDMTWDQVGVKDPAFAGRPITLYGRASNSGTYDYFKEHAIGGKDYKKTVREQPGSGGVVQAVSADRYAMGYSGLGYKTADVKAVKIVVDGSPIEASKANALSGDYPLARFVYVYMNHNPGKALDPLRAEFVRMIYSRQGQEAVVKDGFVALPIEIAREELTKVGLKPAF